MNRINDDADNDNNGVNDNNNEDNHNHDNWGRDISKNENQAFGYELWLIGLKWWTDLQTDIRMDIRMYLRSVCSILI